MLNTDGVFTVPLMFKGELIHDKFIKLTVKRDKIGVKYLFLFVFSLLSGTFC